MNVPPSPTHPSKQWTPVQQELPALSLPLPSPLGKISQLEMTFSSENEHFFKNFTLLPSFFFFPQVNNVRKQGVPFLTFVHVHVNICKHINMLIMGWKSDHPLFYKKESYDIYFLHLACVTNQKTPVEYPPNELAFVYCILSDGCIMIQGRGHHPGLPSPNSLPLGHIRHTTSGSPLPRLGWRWGSLGNPISFLFLKPLLLTSQSQEKAPSVLSAAMVFILIEGT